MNSILVDLPAARGRLLATAIMEPSGKKIMARGRRLENGDIDALARQGVEQVWVVDLAPDERSEDHVLEILLPYLGAGDFEVRPQPAGRVDFVARCSGAMVLHLDRLHALNASGVAVLCTMPQFSRLQAGQRFAQFRSRPFGAPAGRLEALLQLLSTSGPCFDVKAFGEPRVTVLYTDPVRPEKARALFETSVNQRARTHEFTARHETCLEDDEALTQGLRTALAAGPQVVLVASTMAPSVPEDVIGRAMAAAGARLEHYLAPIEPGSLMMVGYAGRTAIVSAPGCFRGAKLNAVDLILPPLLAGHQLSAATLSSLGPGGLLE